MLEVRLMSSILHSPHSLPASLCADEVEKKINPKRRKLKKNRSRSAFRATVSDKSKSTLNLFFALFAVGA